MFLMQPLLSHRCRHCCPDTLPLSRHHPSYCCTPPLQPAPPHRHIPSTACA
ncbi:hypothetical protein BGW80DRAFT_1267873 [Lactifluus volemus]|nr:hypothetical protein BGW80DRAFT_1267873 [Lactifluus volemus]